MSMLLCRVLPTLVTVTAVALAAGTTAATAVPTFYGLTLVTNGPATFGLVRVDGTSGEGTVVGPAHAELFGCGDLVTIAHDTLYYLGDTAAGTTLVGLNITDGTEACSRALNLREIGYVGLGQSLDYDARTDTLVLSGIKNNKTGHAVYRSVASTCGPFTPAGTYGDADYVPMLHSSTLDAAGQRLFVLLSTAQNAATSIGVVDLTGKAPLRTIAEGTPSPADVLVGMHFDTKNQSLVGITADPEAGLLLHSLHVNGGGTWNPPRKLSGVPSSWNALFGNDGSVSTFDMASRRIFFIAGTQDGQGNIVSQDLVAVDVDDAAVVSHPQLSPVGLGGSGLQGLAMMGSVSV